ncbi:DUF4350 domain-containing protein [Undibacterium sp. LX40W]|uniref:DUF4350 domain-containing protein n=1 Tax=Undibacterium nitidum TaxID=2762298 RepID=A0A923HSR5_9BURK|nr:MULTISPECIES: DUF4350 domain-containing protein [Undibacterium]MBC3881857.1 DUF4350 domain-containing protein [Undibacterium nitidum]MBC3892146.1 DUF4350 domain-containing protein [Undibacterium sp. LX40W]
MSQNSYSKSAMGHRTALDYLLWGGLLLLCLGGGWWWLQNMEKSWQPELRQLENYRKQPMLAALRLLEQHGHKINEVDYLSTEAIDKAPNGTLIISNNDGTMSRDQSQHLLNWVERGNTLITFPQMRYEPPKPTKTAVEEAEEEQAKKKTDEDLRKITPYLEPQSRRFNTSMQDPIGDYLGLASVYQYRGSATNAKTNAANNADTVPPPAETSASAASSAEDEYVDDYEEDYDDDEEAGTSPSVMVQNQNLNTYVDSAKVWVQLPHVTRPVQITKPSMVMYSFKRGPKPIYQADNGSHLRVYQHGKGHIIAMPQNIFIGHHLKWDDNAQLLLDCASLNAKFTNFTVIKGLKLAPWYELLWQNFSIALLGLTALILLWSWRGARRFGLLLPEMMLERRSLLEHIEASARWAWTTETGRQRLLEAARVALQEILRRRAPELLRLATPEMFEVMTTQTGLDRASLILAWQEPASRSPHQFTRQIQLLQQLRAHYER